MLRCGACGHNLPWSTFARSQKKRAPAEPHCRDCSAPSANASLQAVLDALRSEHSEPKSATVRQCLDVLAELRADADGATRSDAIDAVLVAARRELHLATSGQDPSATAGHARDEEGSQEDDTCAADDDGRWKEEAGDLVA